MKTIVLLSGGMDSATLLYQCIQEDGKDNVLALAMFYGQRHRCELNAAYNIAKRAGVHYTIVPLDGLRVLLSSALTSDGLVVPEGHYEAESMKSTVVPMRNAIFLSVASGYAWSLGAKRVATAVHAGDHAIYPDCRPAFILAFNMMARQAMQGFADVEIDAPFVHLTKAEIAKVGHELGVPWELTWSCYKGLEKHCGVCGTCVERREALALVGDPTEYM
ncbi:MAG: 7-cyano-7-deazaguanine synthase QueC [Bryobacteraceae bacterium]